MVAPSRPTTTLGLCDCQLSSAAAHHSDPASQALRLWPHDLKETDGGRGGREKVSAAPMQISRLHLRLGQPRLSVHQEAPWTYLFIPFADMQFA